MKRLATLSIIVLFSFTLVASGLFSEAYAADGSVKSTVEINDSTANGPVLSNSDLFGYSVADISDLDGDGVNDIAVGAYKDDNGGTDHGTFVKRTATITFTTSIDSTPRPSITVSDITHNSAKLSWNDLGTHSPITTFDNYTWSITVYDAADGPAYPVRSGESLKSDTTYKAYGQFQDSRDSTFVKRTATITFTTESEP